MGELIVVYRFLVVIPEGKTLLMGTRRKYVNDIMIVLQEVDYSSIGWIDLVQDRVSWRAIFNTLNNFWVP